MNELKALKEELETLPIYEWHDYKVTVNGHLWKLSLVRMAMGYSITFTAPSGREYIYITSKGNYGVGVGKAKIYSANGRVIAECNGHDKSSWKDGDKVLNMTPAHIMDKMWLILDAINEA